MFHWCQCKPGVWSPHAPRSICRRRLEAQHATRPDPQMRSSVHSCTCQILGPQRTIDATTVEAGPFSNFPGSRRSLSFTEPASKVFVIHSARTHRSTHGRCHMRIADVAPRLSESVAASSIMRSKSRQRRNDFPRQTFRVICHVALSCASRIER